MRILSSLIYICNADLVVCCSAGSLCNCILGFALAKARLVGGFLARVIHPELSIVQDGAREGSPWLTLNNLHRGFFL